MHLQLSLFRRNYFAVELAYTTSNEVTNMAKDKAGRWEILSRAANILVGTKRHSRRAWNCRCECGTERVVAEAALRNGTSQSCGCLTRERSSQKHTKHGATVGGNTPEYKAWNAMLQRCHNPKNKRYAQYGGRGIVVCEAWRHDFLAFLSHIGPRPTAKHSIGRIDNDKPYEPGNVRWETGKQQMRNRTVTRYFEVDGKQVSLAELAERYGLPSNTLRNRLLKGWPQDKAFHTPVSGTGPKGPRKKA